MWEVQVQRIVANASAEASGALCFFFEFHHSWGVEVFITQLMNARNYLNLKIGPTALSGLLSTVTQRKEINFQLFSCLLRIKIS